MTEIPTNGLSDDLPEEPAINFPVCSIVGHIMLDGTFESVLISHTEFEDTSEALAAKVAESLYHLNEGNYKHLMVEQLNAQRDLPFDFYRKILRHWEGIYEHDNDTPLVKPSQALHLSQAVKE